MFKAAIAISYDIILPDTGLPVLLGEVYRSSMYSIIWILYLLRSERVKGTFVRHCLCLVDTTGSKASHTFIRVCERLRGRFPVISIGRHNIKNFRSRVKLLVGDLLLSRDQFQFRRNCPFLHSGEINDIWISGLDFSYRKYPSIMIKHPDHLQNNQTGPMGRIS